MIQEIEGKDLKSAICGTILKALPSWLEVKTLDASRASESYTRTRAFYLSAGFEPLECIPEIWGSDNPCLIMVKIVSNGAET